ncbi:hypothetical protein C3363_11350 [Glaesserella parasuis]|nr:hypothetical protein C3363_11350 [Glaesserella parasuis]
MIINSKKISRSPKRYNVSYLPELARLLKQRGIECYSNLYMLNILSDIPYKLIIDLAEYDCGYSVYPYIMTDNEKRKIEEIIDKHLS